MSPVSPQLSFQIITRDDYDTLYRFMQRIYPPAYQHFWEDQGDWYLERIYGKSSFEKDMEAAHAFFYFVLWEGELIGIIRWLEEEPLIDKPQQRASKLQRLYLAQESQGKGVGQQLVNWLCQRQKVRGYELLWLDVMDVQPQAKKFYNKLGFVESGHVFLDFELMHPPMRRMNRMYKEL